MKPVPLLPPTATWRRPPSSWPTATVADESEWLGQAPSPVLSKSAFSPAWAFSLHCCIAQAGWSRVRNGAGVSGRDLPVQWMAGAKRSKNSSYSSSQKGSWGNRTPVYRVRVCCADRYTNKPCLGHAWCQTNPCHSAPGPALQCVEVDGVQPLLTTSWLIHQQNQEQTSSN